MCVGGGGGGGGSVCGEGGCGYYSTRVSAFSCSLSEFAGTGQSMNNCI